MVDDLDAIADNPAVDNPIEAPVSKTAEVAPTITSARISGYKLIVSCSCSLDLNVQPGADDFRVFDGKTELAVQSAYIEHPIIVEHSQIVIALDHLFVGEVALSIKYQPEDSALQMANSNLRMQAFQQTLLASADIGKPAVSKKETVDETHASAEVIDIPILTDSVNIHNFEKVRVTSTELHKQRLTLMFDKELNIEYQPLVSDFRVLHDDKPMPLQSVFLSKPDSASSTVVVMMLSEQPLPGSRLEITYQNASHSLRAKTSALSLAKFVAHVATKGNPLNKPPPYNAMLQDSPNNVNENICVPTLGADQIVYRAPNKQTLSGSTMLKVGLVAAALLALFIIVT